MFNRSTGEAQFLSQDTEGQLTPFARAESLKPCEVKIVEDPNEADALLAIHYDDIYEKMLGYDYPKAVDTISTIILPHLNRGSLAGCRVLDAGCGTGRALYEFSLRGCEVTGFDIDPYMLHVAKANYPNLDFREADMRTLEPLAEYDIVCCFLDPLSSVANTEELDDSIARMAACLRPGGIMVVQKRGKTSIPLTIDEHTFDSYKISKQSRSTTISDEDKTMEYLKHNIKIRHSRNKQPDIAYVFELFRQLVVFDAKDYEKSAINAGLEIVEDITNKEILRRETLVLQKPTY